MNILNIIKMANTHEEESKEYLNKSFSYSNEKISYRDLYESLRKAESPIKSLYYSEILSNSGIHALYDPRYIKEVYYFSENKCTLNIIDSNGKIKTYTIYSTYEIYEIVKVYNLDNLFFGNVKYLKNYNYLKKKTIDFYYELSSFIEMPLIKEEPEIYKYSESFIPSHLSEFYSLYFEYDDISIKTEYFITEERRSLLDLIIYRLSNTNIFKFTGPSGIGKSFFLLYYSRTMYNCIYINLNAIRNLLKSKQYNKLKNVISVECRRVYLSIDQKIAFNKMVANIREMNISIIINELVKFFEQFENIIIILDQFKADVSIDNNKLGNISLILCSSINDKDIRQNCIENFNNLLKV